MAAPARHLALNIGMQTLSLADFRATPSGGLTLHEWKTVEFIVDPAADATRPAQIEAGVHELRSALSLPTRAPASVALPPQSVFSRFVKLPGATAQDVEEIIGFEAQQNVPFPIDEVVWDHQIMGEARGGSWDVGLVAIKADHLTEIVDAVTKGGIRPLTIDAAPMALYNAFLFNYPELTGCSLLVDIGARTTNLIFIEGKRLFNRTIPVGGNSISAALAKEFKQDITVAEKLKIEKGLVGLGGAYEEPSDPLVAKISKVIRNTMTRLHAEIARSISFYRGSQSGNAPVRAYLSGGTVSLPYMTEFFSEKLQIPIEHFNALKNVMVATPELAERASKSAQNLGELVGSALRQTGECPVEINLRPQALVREQDLARRKPFLVVAALCLLAGVGIWLAYFSKAAETAQRKFEEANAVVSLLEGFANRFDAVSKQTKDFEAAAAPLELAIAERGAWISLIEELSQNLPPRFIWITSIVPMTDGKPALSGGPAAGGAPPPSAPAAGKKGRAAAIDALEITGLYLANPPNSQEARIIDQFVENLKNSKSPVFKIEDAAKVVTQRTTPDGQSWAYSYTIRLPLLQPIALP